MLTRVSVQFLFDSCLIPVHSAFNPHSIPVQSLSQSRRIFCLPPVKFPIFSSISSRKHFSFSLSRQIPFSLSPINSPLYNIIRCTFPFPAFPFFLINYQNRPLPQPFTFLFNFFSKKSPFIFVSYLLMPYFCIRFPRDGQHLILTCCNGVGRALQNNKNNFLFIWIIIIKVVIFAVRFAERGSLSDTSFPFAQRGLEIKDGH